MTGGERRGGQAPYLFMWSEKGTSAEAPPLAIIETYQKNAVVVGNNLYH